MKITTKLTLEYLKKNKRRSRVTIIGIATVTILVTTILILFSSYQEYMINIIRKKGNWEARFSNIPYSVTKEISKNENIKEISLCKRIGISNEILTKPECYATIKFDVRAYDENSLKNANINITEGRLPRNSNEILLSLSNSKNLLLAEKISIGDKIQLIIDEVPKEYIVVR